MKAIVVIFPGSNREHDVAWRCDAPRAMTRSASGTARRPSRADLIVLPGGFAYGDYLRCGAMAAHSPVMREVQGARRARHAGARHLQRVSGIDRGRAAAGRAVAEPLAQFTCRDVHLRVENNQTVFTCGYARRPDDPGTGCASRRQLHRRSRHARPARGPRASSRSAIAARTATSSDTDNFNGSARAIAGVFNETRTVLGLMPHPENATDPLLGGTDGQAFFSGLVGALQ